MGAIGRDDNASGVLRSFDAFFDTEYRSVVALAAVLCGRQAVAEELAQEAYFAAYRRWSVVGCYDNPGGWVRRVVANRATSTWRARVREAKAMARIARLREPEAADATLAGDFWTAVRELPARQSQCVALHYLEDLSVEDIATMLAIAPATVRVHLHQGRRRLTSRLGATSEEEER